MKSQYDPLEIYFGDARSKVIELAAFLQRIDRIDPELRNDFRMVGLFKALETLNQPAGSPYTENVLHAMSDPTTEPIKEAHTKAASGVWPGIQK